MALPMHSHVCFGSTFMFEPRSRITWSILYSPIWAVILISLPVRNACFPSFWTTRGSLDPVHLVISSYSPLIALLSCNNFMHVSRNIVSIEGSIPGSSWSLLPKVDASLKLFLASMNVSFAHSKSNLGSFTGALRTHVLSSHFFPVSSPVAIFLLSMIFTFGSSSRDLDLIICIFWAGGGWNNPFSHIFVINVGQFIVSWSNWAQYVQDILIKLIRSWA